MSAAILLLCGLNAVAQGNDSIKNIFLKEFVLTAQDESDRKIKTNNYAGSTTILTNKELNNERINAVKDISLTVPNFYIPDYGSKTTSSIYSRGISTRMNEPSVGLYVDGIPVMNKSLYDFELFNIANIDVALGPQGTLYGRNSISGIIDINTIDESTFDGSIKSSFTTGYGSYNTFKERLTIQGGDKTFGVSASGHYDKSDGYFENEYNGEMNKSESAGGRLNLFWNLPYDWKIKLNGTFDHSAQNAYPYADYTTGKISYDGDGYYRRDFVMSGLTIDKKIGKHKITSATGYQYLDDNMLLDMDYTASPYFTMSDKQRQHTFTEEISFMSKLKWYQQVTGLFGFHTKNDMKSPVTMGTDGVAMVQSIFDGLKAANPKMPAITINNNEININGNFLLTNYGAALYHQSTFTFFKKLTLTAGLRAEYNRTEIKYDNSSVVDMTIKPNSPYAPAIDSVEHHNLNGNAHKEYWEFLPKLSLRYKFNDQWNIYATAAKGFKSGGYNTAITANLMQDMMQHKSVGDVNSTLYYKPEYLWNYEIGMHAQPVDDKLFVDAAVFFIDDRDQQLVRSASNGTRKITNAERVHSYGAEASVRYLPIKNLTLSASYGYTHAEFRKYTVDGVDFKGNTLPFSPESTISAKCQYDIPTNAKYLEKVRLSAEYRALGRIYWDDENEHMQDYKGQLNASVGLIKDKYSLTMWVNNIALDGEQNTFYFESMGKSFVQKAMPVSYGVTLKKEL